MLGVPVLLCLENIISAKGLCYHKSHLEHSMNAVTSLFSYKQQFIGLKEFRLAQKSCEDYYML